MTNEITSVKIELGFIHRRIKIYHSRRTLFSWAGYIYIPWGGAQWTRFFHLRLEKASVTVEL